MRFRSGRLWSATGSKTAALFAGAACAFSVLSASSAFALTVTVLNGQNNGVIAPGPINYPAMMSNCGTATTCTAPTYTPYQAGCCTATTTTGTPTVPGVQVLDNGVTTLSANDGNMLQFNIASSMTSFSNSSGNPASFVAVTMSGTNGSYSSVQLPIPEYQNSLCLQSNSTGTTSCWDAIPLTAWGTSYFPRAVAINPGQNITIGLNLRALCDGMQVSSTFTTSPCYNQLIEPFAAAAAPAAPNAPAAITLTLTFGIYTGPYGVGYAGQSPVDSTTLTINLANSGPTPASNPLTCGLGTVFPGDGSMTFDGSQFSIPSTALTGVQDSLSQVWVLAEQVSQPSAGPLATPLTPNVCSASTQGQEYQYSTSTYGAITCTPGTPDPVGAPYTLGPASTPGLAASPGDVQTGFTNSTDSDIVKYAVGFVGSDNFGFFVQNTSTSTSCAFANPFETAAVLGFVNQSKCFIATATFRSMSSPPLVLLRAFRDRFLEHFPLGRAFVHWYYHWSPQAADWLVANPVFRFPVFLALIPLQIVAWLVLHSLVLLALFMMGLSLMAYALAARSSASGAPDRDGESSG